MAGLFRAWTLNTTLDKSKFALFCSGIMQASQTLGTDVQKYFFANDTVLTAGSVVHSQYLQGAYANASNVFMVSGNGTFTLEIEKYTPASDSWAVLSATVRPGYGPAGFATSTIGYSAGGQPNSGTPKDVDKLTFSNETRTNGTLLPRTKCSPFGACNATVGMIVGGMEDASDNGSYPNSYVTSTDKYTFSGDAVTAGTAINSPGRGSSANAAASTSTKAYFFCGTDNSITYNQTDAYTYSGDTVAAGTALGTVANASAAGNATRAIIHYGYVGAAYTKTTRKYTYSGDTVAAGTDLNTAKGYDTAASTDIGNY